MSRQKNKWQLDGYNAQLTDFDGEAKIPWDLLSTAEITGLLPQNSTFYVNTDGPSEIDMQLVVKLTNVPTDAVVHVGIKKNGVKFAGQDNQTTEATRWVTLAIGGVTCVPGDVFETVIRVNGAPFLQAAQSAWYVQKIS